MAKKSSVLLCGHDGRMGKMIIELLATSNVFGGYVPYSTESNQDIEASVLIDFSSPKGFRESLKFCLKNGIPFVSGTTGLSVSDKKALASAAKKIPVLWASNMSVGVQWFKHALETLSLIAKDYDFQIEEVHHKRKLDSPSGTAITLQAKLEQTIGRKAPRPLAVRGGGVFGIHRLFILGEEETMTIEHQALDRKVFARGALKAAQFLIGKRPGIYSMENVIGLKK